MDEQPIECSIENMGYCPCCAKALGVCGCTVEDYESLANDLLALAQDLREARDDERF